MCIYIIIHIYILCASNPNCHQKKLPSTSAIESVMPLRSRSSSFFSKLPPRKRAKTSFVRRQTSELAEISWDFRFHSRVSFEGFSVSFDMVMFHDINANV